MTILPAKYARIRWDAEHAEAWIGETFTWTDRAGYLDWVAAWKAELHATITAICVAKRERRDPKQNDDARSAAQSRRHYLRIECYNLYLLRSMGKQRAATQRTQRLTSLMPA